MWNVVRADYLKLFRYSVNCENSKFTLHSEFLKGFIKNKHKKKTIFKL